MIEPRDHKWYGWRRSLPDFCDRHYRLPLRYALESALPARVDLRPFCPAPMSQGALGSCVPHAATCAARADRATRGLLDVTFSRLQLYYDGRVAEGTSPASDSGMEVRTAIKCLAKTGVAPEELWPYEVGRFPLRPTQKVYDAAKANEALVYERVDLTQHAIKAALASDHVVIFGITIYNSFESAMVESTGKIPIPNIGAERSIGGHCMYLHGYDDQRDASVVCGRNSWGDDWGANGDFTIPWDYVTNPSLADDFWIIREFGQGAN